MVGKKKQVEMEDRRKIVSANLLAGLTYRQMAEAIGVSLGTIADDVAIIIGRWQREQINDTNEYVRLELIRLDRALNAIWTKVTEGDIKAIETMLRIMERRARYQGLDAPAKQELTGKGGGPIITATTEVNNADELRQFILAIREAGLDTPAPAQDDEIHPAPPDA